MAAKFVLSVDAGGEYRFVLKSGNGETIAASEGYSSKASALNGIDAVKSSAAVAEIDDRT
jgi:uncharacterized protein YegP (UPF0339 family)